MEIFSIFTGVFQKIFRYFLNAVEYFSWIAFSQFFLNRICYTPGSGQAYHVHHPALYYIRNSISDIHDFCRGKMVNIQQFIQSFMFGISFCITCYDSVKIRIYPQLLQCNLTALCSFACDKCYS